MFDATPSFGSAICCKDNMRHPSKDQTSRRQTLMCSADRTELVSARRHVRIFATQRHLTSELKALSWTSQLPSIYSMALVSAPSCHKSSDDELSLRSISCHPSCQSTFRRCFISVVHGKFVAQFYSHPFGPVTPLTLSLPKLFLALNRTPSSANGPAASAMMPKVNTRPNSLYTSLHTCVHTRHPSIVQIYESATRTLGVWAGTCLYACSCAFL